MRNYNINLHITHDAFLKLGRVFSWFPKQAHTHIAKPEVQISSVWSILSALFPPYIIILWKIHLHITQITLASQRRSPKTSFSDFKGITNKINCEAERGDQSLDFDYVCAVCCEDDDDGISTYANVHRSDWKKKKLKRQPRARAGERKKSNLLPWDFSIRSVKSETWVNREMLNGKRADKRGDRKSFWRWRWCMEKGYLTIDKIDAIDAPIRVKGWKANVWKIMQNSHVP